MKFEKLRSGLRRGIEDAPLDPEMRVDLVLILLKAVSELHRIGKCLSAIEKNIRPEFMDAAEHFASDLNGDER